MPHDYLRRLAGPNYRGTAAVHWSMTMADRKTGWLDGPHHNAVRELLLHTLARSGLACPAYCLMPDHGHFLWVGTSPDSDQRKAAAFFRRHWNRRLATQGFRLQLQAHDHVLRPEERTAGAFAIVANYILENPVRAGFCERWQAYPYSGAIVVGRPELDPRDADFHERFWRHWNAIVEGAPFGAPAESLRDPATPDSGSGP